METTRVTTGQKLMRLVPGIRAVSDQIEPYATAWSHDTAAALAGSAPLLGVLGDSTAQGVGASTHRRGWVGQLQPMLEADTGIDWAVANWSRSGARMADVVDEQLPALWAAARRPIVVLVAVGSNDLFWTLRTGPARHDLRRLVDALPVPAVLATVPAQGLAVRARLLNRLLCDLAAERGIGVADVASSIRAGRVRGEPRLARDGFHPNDRGYRDWATAFRPAVADALGTRLTQVPETLGRDRYPRSAWIARVGSRRSHSTSMGRVAPRPRGPRSGSDLGWSWSTD